MDLPIIIIFRGIRNDFKFSYDLLMKVLLANRIAPDCLHMSHKRDARLKWIKVADFLCYLNVVIADIDNELILGRK